MLEQEDPETKHWILVDLLKADEDQIKTFMKKKPEPDEDEGSNGPADGDEDDMYMDSATSQRSKTDDYIKQMVYETVAELHN